MQLPPYSDLIDEQISVYEYPLDRSLFVVGPPGSGKTTLAVMRAKMLVEEYPMPLSISEGSAFVTYNRMLRRLVELLSEDVEAFTMHSFVSRDYKLRTGDDVVPTSPIDVYEFLWSKMSMNVSQKETRSLRIAHIVVDEGQDLPRGFFKYAVERVTRAITVFADENQALGDGCTSLASIRNSAGLRVAWMLKHNHRNSPEIAQLAEHFHSGILPVTSIVRRRIGELPLLVRLPTLHSTAERISNWYQTSGGRIGVIVQTKSFGQSLFESLSNELPSARIDYYTSNDRNEREIELLDPGVTVLNRRSVKGQEFDSVFILQLESFIPCAQDSDRRIMYMMCARARDRLFLVYGPNGLSRAAQKALPGPSVLEREAP